MKGASAAGTIIVRAAQAEVQSLESHRVGLQPITTVLFSFTPISSNMDFRVHQYSPHPFSHTMELIEPTTTRQPGETVIMKLWFFLGYGVSPLDP